MGTQLEARPTEYKGIRFRSKSEAVFARCLDTSQIVSGWIYEPDIDGSPHPWDFSVVVMENAYCNHCKSMSRQPRHLLIEYKPSGVTRTYYDNLIERTREFSEAREDRGVKEDTYIVSGSPWNRAEIANEIDDCSCYGMLPVFSRHWWFGWGDYDPLCRSGCESGSIDHTAKGILGITQAIAASAAGYRYDLRGN